MKTKSSHILFLTLLFVMFISFSRADFYQKLEYKGKNYEYNSLIRSILFVGVDSDDDLETFDRYTIAPRADTMELFILDGYSKTIKVLAISRDTMTSIRRFTMDGTDRGTYVSHLGYAYTFGNGGRISCQNLIEAISFLLNGIPIHEYVVINESGIELGNQLIDGVEVVLPNNDLTEIDPDMIAGKTVFLDEGNVRTFVKYRDIRIPFSNNGRMERAQVYTSAFLDKFKSLVTQAPKETWARIDSSREKIYTSISRNQYLAIANDISNYTFSKDDYYYLGGSNISSASHDELWLTEEDIVPLCLQLFYHEAN